MITCSKYAIIVRNGNIEELKKKVYIDKINHKIIRYTPVHDQRCDFYVNNI